MITAEEQPKWFDCLEVDENLNQYIRDDAPEDVKEAYKRHLDELERMSNAGERVFK